MKHFSIRFEGQSDRGLLRKNNQDYWGVFGDGRFLVVADGMGGHQAGHVAAQEVVNRIGKWYESAELCSENALDELDKAVRQVNRDLFVHAYSDESLRGMGTTLCCLLFIGDKVVRCHVGDSRIYIYRNKKFLQMTRDDSLVADLLDLGQLEPQDVADYQYRNVVTRAIAMEPEVEPHLEEMPIFEEDLFLICSDGLTQMLSDSEIVAVLRKELSLKALCTKLIAGTKSKGARDNVTILLASVVSNDLSGQ